MISQNPHAGRFAGMGSFDDLTLRLSAPGDALALGRLAQLDSTLYDGSRVLVAEVGDELVAALPLDGGAAFADPFRRSAELVALLRLRLGQMAAAGGASPVNGRRDAQRRRAPLLRRLPSRT